MADIFSFFIVTGIILSCLLLILFRFTPKFWVRVLCFSIFLLLVPTSFFAYLSLLSNPKPANFEFFERNDKVLLLSAHWKEEVAIWLWVLLPDTDKPRYYVIPWDKKIAEELQKYLEKAKNNGDSNNGVEIENLFRNPLNNSPESNSIELHPAPQPKMPEKHNPKNNPPVRTYNHPNRDI